VVSRDHGYFDGVVIPNSIAYCKSTAFHATGPSWLGRRYESLLPSHGTSAVASSRTDPVCVYQERYHSTHRNDYHQYLMFHCFCISLNNIRRMKATMSRPEEFWLHIATYIAGRIHMHCIKNCVLYSSAISQ
jgi:hypothetical protein